MTLKTENKNCALMSIKAQLLISKKGENKLLKSEVNVKRVFSYTCVIFIQNAADY